MSDLVQPVHPAHEDFLRDESRRMGAAETISFATSADDVRRALAEAAARGVCVTVQGGRTGITAGAVPDGGHILNLSRMNRITGLREDREGKRFLLRVQPGVLLTDVRAAVQAREFKTDGWSAESLAALEALRAAGHHFFPPDPTETTATIGGMISCNASGACSFLYGPTRNYVERLSVVLADGTLLDLPRGRFHAEGRGFSLVAGGRALEGRLPSYTLPRVKSAAGYYAADHMDLVDLFIGAEGTLGVLVEAEVALIPAPAFIWGVMAFLPSDTEAIRYVRRVREGPGSVGAAAVEFFDRRALELLARARKDRAAFAELPATPAGSAAAVYTEFHAGNEDALTDTVSALAEIIAACGGDENATWIADTARELDRMHTFRHAVPEAVNLLIDERRRASPGLTKLGTDMAVPDDQLEEVLLLYRGGLEGAGLEYVMFGHIGDNHIHVNILPRDQAEYERGRALYLAWAKEILAMGGTVSAEHGIGKLKVAMLREMYGERGIAEMRAVKRVFDPEFRLNRGNLFGEG